MKHAYVAGPVLLAALTLAQVASAQELGRLFTTSAQRAALERARFSTPAGTQPSAESMAAAPSEAAPATREGEQVLVVNGVVRRSGSGRDTIWVNDTPVPSGSRLQGGATLAQDRSGMVALTLRSGKKVLVKPGQNVDAVTGRVRDGAPPPPPVEPPPDASGQ